MPGKDDEKPDVSEGGDGTPSGEKRKAGSPTEILYSMVARKNAEGGAAKVTVLSEYTTTTGNFQQISRKICDKLPAKDTKMSYTYDTHVFHMLIEQGCIFMCMVKVQDEGSKRLPFAFLDDIKARFKERYTTRFTTVPASECYESFALVLRARMEYFSKNPQLDKVDHIRGQVEEVKGIMVDNVDHLLQRGEKLQLLVTKTEDLASEAHTFKKRATELKKKMWWRNCKMTLIIALPIIVGCFWAIFWLCGGITFCNCGNKCFGGGDKKGGGDGGGDAPAPPPGLAAIGVSVVEAVISNVQL